MTDFYHGKELFLAYADSLGIDLCFQDFPEELKNLHVQYKEPKGALFIAMQEDRPIACAAIREYEGDTAELKRMYVIPEKRELKIGKRSLELSLSKAKELGYKKIRLDTLPEMLTAQVMYRAAGFYEIKPYRYNPDAKTVYMEKAL